MIEFPVPITYGNLGGCPTQSDMYGVVVLDGKDEALTLSRQAMCGGAVVGYRLQWSATSMYMQFLSEGADKLRMQLVHLPLHFLFLVLSVWSPTLQQYVLEFSIVNLCLFHLE